MEIKKTSIEGVLIISPGYSKTLEDISSRASRRENLMKR